ncbi:hypothetical protein [Streptomyces sp. NPDC086776]|uniref:hypothetical protein n=1 Tax=Streptomyces sp. NPDC086776 TaxID=3365756 RepID=UPI0037F36D90
MFGMLVFPPDFEPEDHGWHVVEPIAPQQRVQHAVHELSYFGFVSTHFQRWEIPYRSPAALVRCGYDAEADRYYGMYMPPFERDRSSFTLAEIHHQLRYGMGGGANSPDRPSVSQPTVSDE